MLGGESVVTAVGMEANAGSRWVMSRDPAGNLVELACIKPN
jgi:hypothetical protein